MSRCRQLTDPAHFRAALADARRALLKCPCRDEGRLACHRCLHRYTEERHQDTVSRLEALQIINDLLGPVDQDGEPVLGEDGQPVDLWKVAQLPSTDLIGLDKQVESDLEARFLAALRAWTGGEQDAVLEESSTASGYLRFSQGANWRLTAQRDMEFTRTDFTFESTDGPKEYVTVYLDGHRYHATRAHNRIAADCDKRNQLRDRNHVVFQITWDDLELFEKREAAKAQPVWPPYPRSAQDTAKDWYEEMDGERADLAEAVFANPVDTLLAYLREPVKERWARRAKALVGGLMSEPTALAMQVDRGQARQVLRSALDAYGAGSIPSAEPVTGDGAILVLQATDMSGLPVVLTVDASAGEDAKAVRWSALAVLDDRDEVLGTDEHKRCWRAWLYWSNVLQFLAFAGGDGIQLAGSRAAAFPVDVLAVTGGIGELDSLIAAHRPQEPPTAVTLDAPDTTPEVEAGDSVAEQAVAQLLRDAAWDEDIIPLLEEDEPDSALTRLARKLAEHGKQAPVFGYELGERRWPADFAWQNPGIQVAVVAAPHGEDDEEALRRDKVYADAGWTVRTAADWLDHLDSLVDRLPDAPEARGSNDSHESHGNGRQH